MVTERRPWPVEAVIFIYRQRDLIWQLGRRNITSRYKGTYLGLLWSFLNPLVMLTIYTFVFSYVMKARWGVNPSENHSEFALTLFCGLIPFNIFAELMTASPGLIVGNTNYVKKIVFPLEVLPVSLLLSSLVHAGISMLILLAGASILAQPPGWTLVFLPLALLPLIALSLGVAWFLSSLGVFIRDIGYTVSLISQGLFFLTPLFYPIRAVPDEMKVLLELNPLSAIVESFRCIILWHKSPPLSWLAFVTVVSLGVYFFGYFWFMKSKRAFADGL